MGEHWAPGAENKGDALVSYGWIIGFLGFLVFLSSTVLGVSMLITGGLMQIWGANKFFSYQNCKTEAGDDKGFRITGIVHLILGLGFLACAIILTIYFP